MKQQKQIITLDEFGQYVSLNNIIAAGQGKTVLRLQKIADSLEYDNYHNIVRFPNILLVGDEGKTTLAKAYANTLCMQSEAIAGDHFMTLGVIRDFFYDASPEKAYIITNAEKIPSLCLHPITQILQRREYTYYDYNKQSKVVCPVLGCFILTTTNMANMHLPILNLLHYIIKQEKFTLPQKERIASVHLKNYGITWESDKVIKDIAMKSITLAGMIALIRTCLDLIKSDCRMVLTDQDVSTAFSLAFGF